MGVEKYGLGGFEVFCIFYEIESRSVGVGAGIKRDARRAYERAADCEAIPGCFITMKLNQGQGNTGAGSYDFNSGRINKKQHRGNKRRQPPGQRGGAFSAVLARAGCIQYKSNRIRARGYRGIDIFFPRQAANLHARPGGGSGC